MKIQTFRILNKNETELKSCISIVFKLTKKCNSIVIASF
ncbi:hypothetical protein L289_1912 [Acinetobacter gerneri DSM 14967 = CIP 107464 = MTCC 9824]|nr:hypothetical protein L289_1912 [Acinetobacter gerneri DSM 14967 = CIP 107464 = MTCC 9824]